MQVPKESGFRGSAGMPQSFLMRADEVIEGLSGL
jgi:hypothetical protein